MLTPVIVALLVAGVVLIRRSSSTAKFWPRRLPGPQPGDPLPTEIRHLMRDRVRQGGVVLLFLSSGCDACRRLVAEFAADPSWRDSVGMGSGRLLAFVTGDFARKLPEGIFHDVVAVRDEAAITSFGIDVLPFVMSVDAQNVVTQTKVPLRAVELREWLKSAHSGN